LAAGAFSPLEGFMPREEALSVMSDFRLRNGKLWAMPILLQIKDAKRGTYREGMRVGLSLPPEFTRREIAAILAEAERSRGAA
jgi:ATP sulfurylase